MKNSRLASFFCFLCIATGCMPAKGQLNENNLDPENRTNGKITLKAVETQRSIIQKISAVILVDQMPVANGTVMTSDGYILTKADGLKGIKKLAVRVDTKLYTDVSLLAEDRDADLALLKIDAEDLATPEWADLPAIGSIVVSNGATTRTSRRARLGIVSAHTRPIPASGGNAFLGIAFAPHEGLKVANAFPDFAAANAGIKEGDILLTINDRKIDYPEDVMSLLKGRKPGDAVRLTVNRKGEEIELSSKLVASPYDRNDMMSGRLNKRRDNFPESIQHDIPLSVYNSGGPLVTLEGKTVGINIARANRAESFALTRKSVETALQKLMEEAKKAK